MDREACRVVVHGVTESDMTEWLNCTELNIFLSMIVQRLVAILEFSQENMSTCPTTPPSCSFSLWFHFWYILNFSICVWYSLLLHFVWIIEKGTWYTFSLKSLFFWCVCLYFSSRKFADIFSSNIDASLFFPCRAVLRYVWPANYTLHVL